MIGRLRGIIVAAGPEGAVIDVAGVGYEVSLAPRSLAELPAIGEEAVVHTHLYVREDTQQLFGFVSEHEQSMFRVLLTASGVGPKLAMAILASLRPEEIERAITTEDSATLSLVPGIGKRTAQRLILELQPKVGAVAGSAPAADVRAALEGLGYQPAEISEVLTALPTDLTLKEQIRTALQELGRS